MHITYHPSSSSFNSTSRSPHICLLSPEYPHPLYNTIQLGSGVSGITGTGVGYGPLEQNNLMQLFELSQLCVPHDLWEHAYNVSSFPLQTTSSSQNLINKYF
jgi:hypothetical protein